MNSAELPTSLPSTAEQPPWSDVRRIYRRICLLRATGNNEEASALEHNEFSAVLAYARKAPEAAQRETVIFAEESERVASASVLAESLAPILATKLQASASGATGEASASVSPRKTEVTLAAPPRRARASSPDVPESPASGVPGIADMIEGMLSQERDPTPARRGA